MKKYITAICSVILFVGLYQYGQSAALSLTDVPNEANIKTIKDTINANNVLLEAFVVGNIPIANTKIIIGGSGGYGAAYPLSGDVTMGNTGLVTIASGAIVGPEISSAAISNTHLSAACITGNKLATGAISNGALSSACITGDKVTTLAVSNTHLSADCITGDKIIANAISNADLSTACITEDKFGTFMTNIVLYLTNDGASSGYTLTFTNGVLKFGNPL